MGAGRAWIGTSGWSYQHWREVFYPRSLSPRHWLEFYAARFGTVEINATFYRLPALATFENWKRSTPAGFQFTVKAHRLITHLHRLKDAGPAWESFWRSAQGLGEKLACILVQLPPSMPAHPDRLAAFGRLLPPGVRFAFEFRHPSWFEEPVYAVLREHGFALCQASSPHHPGPAVDTAPFRYLRMHGGPSIEQSDYSQAALEAWAASIQASTAGGQDVYAYFNNDPRGYAVKNADYLQSLLHA